QYNGKEYSEDLGLNWNDYGARWFDPEIAKWRSIDPMAEKYYPLSSYSYVADNPLIFVDPDGNRIIVNGQIWTMGAKFEGEDDSFGAKIFNTLNTIAEKSQSGKKWLNELADLETFDFNIKESSQRLNRFVPDNESEIYKDENGRNKATIPEPGGGTVFVNLNAQEGAVETETGFQFDFEANLSHELIGHGIDVKEGRNDENRAPGQIIENNEYSASERENIIRAEMGKPLRTHYGNSPLINWSNKNKAMIAIPSGKIIRQNVRNYKKRD
ncbi:MAG TPA: RHS repeat-associated core domain-containing protein, partial [Ignavibacteria bacterium]|nr:RHS repeat-associated core domain-containing protein [Ignavibacteria bacterium]HMR42055.1 RHS repeat-associated core domain-containing protein [Ignavibacteria bacterium]